MSDMNVPSASPAPQSQWAQRKSLFDQLGQALQKGDLKAAQTAFAALQQSASRGVPQNGEGSGSSSPLAALADALGKGDLSGAQQAFSQIQQARGHHHHPKAEAHARTATVPAPTAAAVQDKDGDYDGSGTKVDLTA